MIKFLILPLSLSLTGMVLADTGIDTGNTPYARSTASTEFSASIKDTWVLPIQNEPEILKNFQAKYAANGQPRIALVFPAEAVELREAFERPLIQAGARLVPAPAPDAPSDTLKNTADVVVRVEATREYVVIPKPSGLDETRVRWKLLASAITVKTGERLAAVNSEQLFGLEGLKPSFLARHSLHVSSNDVATQTALALMQEATRSK